MEEPKSTLPSFRCEIVEDESCLGDGQGSDNLARGKALFDQESLSAFVFSSAMEAPLAAARQRWQDAGAVEVASAGAVGWEPQGAGVDARQARQAVFSPLGRLLFDLDADVLGLTGPKAFGPPSKLPTGGMEIYSALERDGALELGDVNLPPELQAEALSALTRGPALSAARPKLPALETWLRTNLALASAVAAYLGGRAVLHGYKVVHLPSTLTTKEFISAHWHHDRAGRRLKLFLRLNDVDPLEGHPTQVALGSHRLSYYWHEEFEQSRYADLYVRSHFETLRLAGRKGTGYIFDTNTIHKGTPEGSQSRDVIVVEYHHAAKCGLISSLGLNIPCPSGDQKALNWYFDLTEGKVRWIPENLEEAAEEEKTSGKRDLAHALCDKLVATRLQRSLGWDANGQLKDGLHAQILMEKPSFVRIDREARRPDSNAWFGEESKRIPLK
ncbi:unnamed protein product [Symbiodinium pilosum]|uniref:Uncharacterized protein n=1 Tax=Symbiodinium pilosum TaxID=2952 RepID=A0A812MYH3_SYMPI|nr:unnamed protein product [Symbiodinium pilosum]